MRLIDADELEKVMTEDWFLEILATQDSKSAIKKDIVNCIDSVPLAFDVEAVIAELEKQSYTTTDTVCGGRFKAIRLSSAIEIVRGKE